MIGGFHLSRDSFKRSLEFICGTMDRTNTNQVATQEISSNRIKRSLKSSKEISLNKSRDLSRISRDLLTPIIFLFSPLPPLSCFQKTSRNNIIIPTQAITTTASLL